MYNFIAIYRLLEDAGYIEVFGHRTRITLRGLEYLQQNSLMQKSRKPHVRFAAFLLCKSDGKPPLFLFARISHLKNGTVKEHEQGHDLQI